MTTSKRSVDNKQLDHDLAKRQSSDVIRVCSDCHTTTTPLWRSGPQGPKVFIPIFQLNTRSHPNFLYINAYDQTFFFKGVIK